MMLRHCPNRRAHNAIATLAIGLSSLLLAGCSVFGIGGTDPELYDTVDAVVAELDLESAGEVVHAGHYGTGEFSSSPPTVELVIELKTNPHVIEQAILDAGFNTIGKTSWDRGRGADMVSVSMVVVDPGHVVKTGDGAETKVTKESAVIAVTSYD